MASGRFLLFLALTLLASCSAGFVQKIYEAGTSCTKPSPGNADLHFSKCLSKSETTCVAYDDAMSAVNDAWGVKGKTLYIAYINATHGFIKWGCTGICGSTCMLEVFFQFDACIAGPGLDWTIAADMFPTVKTLASSVKFVFFSVYSDDKCTTPYAEPGCSNEPGFDDCYYMLDQCSYLPSWAQKPGGTWKYVVKNNKIFQQMWNTAGSNCCGVPDSSHSNDLSGATINSSVCVYHHEQFLKDVTIGHMTKKRLGLYRYYKDSACTQSVEGVGLSFMHDNPAGECKQTYEMDYMKQNDSRIPKSVVSGRDVCKSKLAMTAFYETANCAGCPSVVLPRYISADDANACKLQPEAGGQSYRKGFVCENMKDTQQCGPQSQGQTNKPDEAANKAAGTSKYILAVLMLWF